MGLSDKNKALLLIDNSVQYVLFHFSDHEFYEGVLLCPLPNLLPDVIGRNQ